MGIAEAGDMQGIGENSFPEGDGEIGIAVIEMPGGQLMGGFKSGARMEPASIDFSIFAEVEIALSGPQHGARFAAVNEFIFISDLLRGIGEQLGHVGPDADEAKTVGTRFESVVGGIENFLELMEGGFGAVFAEESIGGVLPGS